MKLGLLVFWQHMNRRWWVRQICLAWLLAMFVAVASCTSNPPDRADNICAVFEQKGGWHKQAKRAQKRWGLPVAVGMAFIHRESHYVADAKPPRKKLLGIVPWTRLSSAYGYAQATDEAWQDYQKETDRWFVDRDSFSDAIDFIGWYNHRSHRRLGISKQNAYHMYLAYYTGPTGYAKGVWKKSPSIKGYAGKVAVQAKRYTQQLKRC